MASMRNKEPPHDVTIVRNEAGKFMGMTALKIDAPKNRDAELGICIRKEWWGNGYGTEIVEWLVSYAFEKMGLRRLSLGVFEVDKRAMALYDKVGFICKIVKREALWVEGKWVDIICMGMLKTEYQARTVCKLEAKRGGST